MKPRYNIYDVAEYQRYLLNIEEMSNSPYGAFVNIKPFEAWLDDKQFWGRKAKKEKEEKDKIAADWEKRKAEIREEALKAKTTQTQPNDMNQLLRMGNSSRNQLEEYAALQAALRQVGGPPPPHARFLPYGELNSEELKQLAPGQFKRCSPDFNVKSYFNEEEEDLSICERIKRWFK